MLLCQYGLVSTTQLQQALTAQSKSHQLLGKILVKQSALKTSDLWVILGWQKLIRALAFMTGFVFCTIHPHALGEDKIATGQAQTNLSQIKEAISQTRPFGNLSTIVTQYDNALVNQYRALENTSKKITVKLKEQFNSSMMILLKGEGHTGVDAYSEGMSYQAVWSSKYFLVEAKYKFN